MAIKKYFFYSFLLCFMFSCDSTSLVDINGNKYNTTKIGEQVWMTQNLNVDRFRNGDLIKEATSFEEWYKPEPRWCYYNFDEKYGEKYGKLYNYHAVVDLRGLAPEGWHIPSSEEWLDLYFFFNKRYKKYLNELKSTKGWKKNKNGIDKFGFNGLPSGMVDGGAFLFEGYFACWWSTTKKGREILTSKGLGYGRDGVNTYGEEHQGFPVRCLKGEDKEVKKYLENKQDIKYGKTKDIDCNLYKTTQINSKNWMAENLKVKRFRNGDEIPRSKTKTEWLEASRNQKPSWCYALDYSGNEMKNAILYNWFAVNDKRGLAQKGWHIPNDLEWTKLKNETNEINNNSSNLKLNIGWIGNYNNSNKYGFDAIPNGFRHGAFDGYGTRNAGENVWPYATAIWWCSNEINDKKANIIILGQGDNLDLNNQFKDYGYSVRCIEN